jgi:transcriptional regulator
MENSQPLLAAKAGLSLVQVCSMRFLRHNAKRIVRHAACRRNVVSPMAYPPLPYRVTDPAAAVRLMGAHPFAHLFTAHNGLKATRIPLIVDCENGRAVRLRAHLDARNPQAQDIDGAPVLVAFSGPAAYVSPHWRADKTKGGTYDYQEVQVHGTARVVNDIGFFRRLIDDLSLLIEPQHAEIGDYPVWQTTMARDGHIAEQLPGVTPFVVEIDVLETTFKLHQNFPEADRQSVAEHLSRSHREDVRAIAEEIRRQTDDNDR